MHASLFCDRCVVGSFISVFLHGFVADQRFPFQQMQAQLAALQNLAAMSQVTAAAAPLTVPPLTPTTVAPFVANNGTVQNSGRKRALEDEQMATAGSSSQQFDQNPLLFAAAAAAAAVPFLLRHSFAAFFRFYYKFDSL